MRHFVGGQQKLLPELLAMVAPTVNSYRRLIPGFWAPTDATWGIENRTCALRVIPRQREVAARRIPHRRCGLPIPTSVLAAALASGLRGIETRSSRSKPVEGNAYAQTLPKKLALPRTLWDAAQRLKGSKMARDWFGERFCRALCGDARMGRA